MLSLEEGLVFDGDEWFIENLEPVNDTFVNLIPLEHREREQGPDLRVEDEDLVGEAGLALV